MKNKKLLSKPVFKDALDKFPPNFIYAIYLKKLLIDEIMTLTTVIIPKNCPIKPRVLLLIKKKIK